MTTALETFRFDEAAHRLYHFAWGTFCDWYLEFTKPILQGEDEAARAETQATTAWVLRQLVHLLHPVMPFITEELWRQLAGEGAGMLIRADWPDLPPDLHDPEAAAEMDWVVAAITAIRAIRTEVNVPAGRAPAAAGQGCRCRRGRRGSNATASTSSASPGSNGIEAVETVPAGGVAAVVEGTTLILRVGDVIDLGKEKARLAKEIGRLDADLKKFGQKLGNPAFLAKAKPEVVEEQREREADARRDRDRLQAVYDRIAAG